MTIGQYRTICKQHHCAVHLYNVQDKLRITHIFTKLLYIYTNINCSCRFQYSTFTEQWRRKKHWYPGAFSLQVVYIQSNQSFVCIQGIQPDICIQCIQPAGCLYPKHSAYRLSISKAFSVQHNRTYVCFD